MPAAARQRLLRAARSRRLEAGSQARAGRQIELGLHTSGTLLHQAPRLGVGRARGAPGPRRRRRLAKPRTRVAAETRERDTSTSTDASEPLRPGADPVDRSGTRSRIPRESNGPPSWRRRGAVVLRLSPSSGADESQSTRRRGGRGSPRTTVTRLGRRGAILRAAQPHSDHASGTRQPPQPGQPEQSARPESAGRDQVR